jgi:hypothetical protein
MSNSFIREVKDTAKNVFNKSIRNPLMTFLVGSTIAIAPFLPGCGGNDGDEVGPVYDIQRIEINQDGGGWGFPAIHPDWIYCDDCGGNIPCDDYVNSTGFNTFVRFFDQNNEILNIPGIEVDISNQSGSSSVLGVWNPLDPEVYPDATDIDRSTWNEYNSVNAENYGGFAYPTDSGYSVAMVTNGICASWPIGGLFYTGKTMKGVPNGELGARF